MAINNTPKPTGSVNNTPRVFNSELWSTITTTWASETRTWDECITLMRNTAKPFTLGSTTSTTYTAPGTAENGTGLNTWSTPSNALTSDNTYTAFAHFGSRTVSNELRVTNFGFNIPTGAVILGVTVEVDRTALNSGVYDSVVKLIKAGTTSGNNKPNTTVWPISEATQTYGSATDLWGLSFSASDINASDFGFAFQASVDYANGAYVDQIRMRISYAVYTEGIINNTPKPST